MSFGPKRIKRAIPPSKRPVELSAIKYVPENSSSGLDHFYALQATEPVWQEDALLPDVAAVIAALFAGDCRCDVALVVRMVLPLENPEPIKAAKVRSTVDGEVVFDKMNIYRAFVRDFLPFRPEMPSGMKPDDCFQLLTFLCHREQDEPTGYFLSAAGVLPRSALPMDGRRCVEHAMLALVIAGDFIDVYEILIARYKSEYNAMMHHIDEVCVSLAKTRRKSFRFFHSLLREFPEEMKTKVLQAHCDVTNTNWDSPDWSNDWIQLRFHFDTITQICKLGNTGHVQILRYLFGHILKLGVLAQDVYMAFTNPEAGDVTTGQDLGLLRLLCEELRQGPNLAQDLSRDFFPWIVGRLKDTNEASRRISRQEFQSRTLYIAQQFSLTPNEEVLAVVLAYDSELHNELQALLLVRRVG